MNIIIPMAGRGSRLRPHTLTVPKPLVPVAGKPIVQRLVEDLMDMTDKEVENIGFIIKDDFGAEIEADLIKIADKVGAKGHIFYQGDPLGTAHAILCAEPLLTGNVIVAFADTLFKANYQFDSQKDGVIICQKVDDPSAFGVVKLDDDNYITEFVEKPETFVSDLAIIGIYYVKDGDAAKAEIHHLIDNDIKDKGEYQWTNVLENLKAKGARFSVGTVEEWLDCGNKNATVYTNQRVLELKKDGLASNDPEMLNSLVVEPCYIGKNVKIHNSIVGPHVSIGDGCSVENVILKNCLIQNDTHIKNKVVANSMIGSKVQINGVADELSIGDFSVVEF